MSSSITAAKRIATTQTHVVTNQARLWKNFNFFQADPSLQRAMAAYQIDKPQINAISNFGAQCGALMDAAERAEKNIPKLKQFDQHGRRIDQVEYHPDYPLLMSHGLRAGCAAYGYNNRDLHSSHVTRGALIYMENQLEPGHCCPIVMTSAAIPVLRRISGSGGPLDPLFVQKLATQEYDGRDIPLKEKQAATCGMSMTEKQGGSDVRANTTIATPLEAGKKGLGEAYLLKGHKWFTSAPMSDFFLTLAKTSEKAPPSCFLVPRWIPDDGSRNEGFRVMRLKDKLADRANASSEVEYDNAYGILISEEGKGIKSIIEMVNSTRMDCAIGSAAGAKRALQYALNHTNTRRAFGTELSNQPLMANVLTALCIESEAHTLTSMRVAKAFDEIDKGTASKEEEEFFRVAVSVAKYYITKRCPNFTYEAMECLGGNSFVEDFPLARLFRHSPLNSIWEGSGNVLVLDVLRAVGSFPYFFLELSKSKGMIKQYDNYLANLEQLATKIGRDPMSVESQRGARYLVDSLAIALEAHCLLSHGGLSKITELYVESYMGNSHSMCGHNVGTFVYSEHDSKVIIEDSMASIFV